jgi:hypothetical protein
MTLSRSDKTALFIDGANLYATAKTQAPRDEKGD